MKLRVGVIGAGIMGRLHLKAYSKIRNVELVCVADSDTKALEQAKTDYNIKGYKDYHEMLSEEKLEAVSVAVPSNMHKSVACDVIDKGIHVLVEKPLAMSVDEGKIIIEHARSKNVKLMVGHIERFNPVIEVIKKNIDPSKIISINITRVSPFPPRMGNIGVIKDVGVHDIDLIRYISGSEFEEINALSSSNITDKEDTAVLSFKMKNGALANINTNWLTPYRVRDIEIATKEKFVKASLLTQQVFEYSAFQADYRDARYVVKQLAVPFGESIVRELEHFTDCVINNKSPLITGEDGLKAIEIAEKCSKG